MAEIKGPIVFLYLNVPNALFCTRRYACEHHAHGRHNKIIYFQKSSFLSISAYFELLQEVVLREVSEKSPHQPSGMFYELYS